MQVKIFVMYLVMLYPPSLRVFVYPHSPEIQPRPLPRPLVEDSGPGQKASPVLGQPFILNLNSIQTLTDLAAYPNDKESNLPVKYPQMPEIFSKRDLILQPQKNIIKLSCKYL